MWLPWAGAPSPGRRGKLACVAGPKQPCATCRLRRGCHYTRLFETFMDFIGGEPPPFLRGLDTAPRPYVFEPVRRVLELATFHVPEADPDWTFRPLLEHAGTVRIAASDLRWFDWERYSNRQGRKVDMGGLLGSVELEGDLAPLAALLRTAELVHVGKGATFGLGKVEVE